MYTSIIITRCDIYSTSTNMHGTVFLLQSWTKDHNGPVSTHLVAKEFVNTPVPDAIVFRNPRFFLRRPFSSLPTEQYSRYKNHDVMFNLKHPSFNVRVFTVFLV